MSTKFRETPETDPLARKWGQRVTEARRHWDSFHRRIRHNRQIVSGLDWNREPDETDFYLHRANLIHSTIMGILPGIYARNPEIAVTPQHASRDLKLLCKTIEKVTNRYLEDAQLKTRAKSTVRAALTCSFGVLKVMYQRKMQQDSLIHARIQDSQDNLMRARGLEMQLEADGHRGDTDSRQEEIEQTLSAVGEKVEVGKTEGLVIDRVMTENLLVDPAVAEFWDYEQADWMIQIVPMKKALAEGLYGFRLDKATVYRHPGASSGHSGRLFSGEKTGASDDAQICVLEIWDKTTQRVYTMAEGCDFWLREPYSPPKIGERWYPFFLLPFQTVDGRFIGPSIVDLTERLQDEHNTARDRYNEHRELIKPGYIASAEINERTLKRFSDAELGEITLIDSDGQPIQQAIMPKTYPPIDPSVYDTSPVRLDWEMVTGLQDASRASVVKPKTATEANILQQSLSNRVSEFRDQVEDFLQQIAQYTAEILIQELDEKQVEKIMGPHKKGILPDVVNPATGAPVVGVTELAYDWPKLSKDEVFHLVQLKIRAGTTGVPDDLERQDAWTRLLPVMQPLIGQIMQFQLQGVNPTAMISLLKETVMRFDDKLDLDAFVPHLEKQPEPASPGETAVPAASGLPERKENGASQPLPGEKGMPQAGAIPADTPAMPSASAARPGNVSAPEPAGKAAPDASAIPPALAALLSQSGSGVPDAPGSPDRTPEGTREARVKLSPEAARHLPPEILELLGPDALPDGHETGQPVPGQERSVPAVSGQGAAKPAGDGVDDEKLNRVREVLAPLADELLSGRDTAGNGNARNALLKDRLKTGPSRRKKNEPKRKKTDPTVR